MSLAFDKTSHVSLSCKLVPVQYREHEYSLFIFSGNLVHARKSLFELFSQFNRTIYLTPVVANAMYTFHAYDDPYAQENFTLNDCWRSVDGRFFLKQFCHVFIARVPSLYGKPIDSISFESACLPGYFLRQKNYHFFLRKRDGTRLFGNKLFQKSLPYLHTCCSFFVVEDDHDV